MQGGGEHHLADQPQSVASLLLQAKKESNQLHSQLVFIQCGHSLQSATLSRATFAGGAARGFGRGEECRIEAMIVLHAAHYEALQDLQDE